MSVVADTVNPASDELALRLRTSNAPAMARIETWSQNDQEYGHDQGTRASSTARQRAPGRLRTETGMSQLDRTTSPFYDNQTSRNDLQAAGEATGMAIMEIQSHQHLQSFEPNQLHRKCTLETRPLLVNYIRL